MAAPWSAVVPGVVGLGAATVVSTHSNEQFPDPDGARADGPEADVRRHGSVPAGGAAPARFLAADRAHGSLRQVASRTAVECPLPVPSGWYCVGFSDEFGRETVVPRVLAGNELAVFRTGSGALAAVDAHCPHLGASFVRGGTVQGEQLRCPFHGFCFTTDGACASTPYDGKPPPRARLGTWPVRELHGLVMVWYGAAGEVPQWEVSDVSMDGWTRWYHHRFDLRTHPQEVAENSVDYGHFTTVHEYGEVEILSPLVVDGPRLQTHFSFVRPGGLLGRRFVRTEAKVHQWGLGYARVEVGIAEYGLRLRQLVLSMPLDRESLHLRIARWSYVEDSGNMEENAGYWVVRSWGEDGGQTLARYFFSADPGLKIPDFIEKWATRKMLPRIMENLRAEVAP